MRILKGENKEREKKRKKKRKRKIFEVLMTEFSQSNDRAGKLKHKKLREH